LVLPLAKGLKQSGHKVQILTGFPNYPGGNVFPGYKIKLWQREVLENLPILRVVLYPSHNNSALKRIANYVSFAFSSAAIGLLFLKKPDIIYAYHPPATIGLPTIAFHWFKRAPFVYHIQDLWPDTLGATGMFNNKIGLKIIGKWCDFIYQQANRIVVISPGFKKVLLDRGVPDDKIKVIYNWCPDENQIKPQNKDENLSIKLGLSNRFNVVSAGAIGKAQALDAVLDAAHLIAKQLPIIQFVFVGDGVDAVRLKERVINEKLSNILFLPWCPVPEVARILAIADLAFVHLKDKPLFEITIPGRTQAYMAAGKPILMGVKGDAAEIVKKAGVGIVCTPENPKSIADSIERLFNMSRIQLDTMGRNGREFYEKELSLHKAVEEFENMFKLVVENKVNGKKNI